MLTSLDAAAVRRWCALGLDALRSHRDEIDALNVYPVPDGDTGTNLVLTFTAAADALAADLAVDLAAGDVGGVLRCMARGALLGARGNSGVIVSQLLRGLADHLRSEPLVRGRELAAALGTAAQACYEAVAEPVEGTILSVARAAAEAAATADTDDLGAVADAAATEAAAALARTPSQLPALARAGVVDAGGRGLVVLLDALVAVVSGTEPVSAPLARVVRGSAQLLTRREAGSTAYAYEVQFLLDAHAEAVTVLKGELKNLGDSVVIVGAGAGETDTWNVHAHVNDVGAAIEAGIEAGRPHRISVTRFDDTPETPFDPDARATVAVAEGPGLERLFAAEGVTVVASASPSTVDLLTAIVESGAGNVVVLPNDGNVRAVATAAAEEARARGQVVSVVHTKSPVQGIAALAVRDPARRFDEDVIAMAEAAAATRWAEVTVAVRDALTLAGPCRAGDVLALVEGEVVLIAHEVYRAAQDLLDRMLGGGGELVTLVIGAEAPEGFGAALEAHVREKWPFVEAQVYDGGQPHYPLLVGVE